jgi:hypothetical protein
MTFAVAALPAQDEAQAIWQKVEKGEPRIELRWRRDARGNCCASRPKTMRCT